MPPLPSVNAFANPNLRSDSPTFAVPKIQHVYDPLAQPPTKEQIRRSNKPSLVLAQAYTPLSFPRLPTKANTIPQPFSARAAMIFLAAGACMIFYFRYEKARMERRRVADATKGVGRPKVGGKFELVDHEGKRFTDEDMKGGYSLVYFGFTHCPDICPEELDKLSRMIDLVSTTTKSQISTSAFVSPSSPSHPLLPIFITCDPARDTPSVLKTYLTEFHPGIVGLTGTWEQVKDVCKKFRVYFSTPSDVKPGMDYLVDHSIYFYLMDPEGDFVEAIGRQHSAEVAARIIVEHMGDWKGVMKR